MTAPDPASFGQMGRKFGRTAVEPGAVSRPAGLRKSFTSSTLPVISVPRVPSAGTGRIFPTKSPLSQRKRMSGDEESSLASLKNLVSNWDSGEESDEQGFPEEIEIVSPFGVSLTQHEEGSILVNSMPVKHPRGLISNEPMSCHEYHMEERRVIEVLRRDLVAKEKECSSSRHSIRELRAKAERMDNAHRDELQLRNLRMQEMQATMDALELSRKAEMEATQAAVCRRETDERHHGEEMNMLKKITSSLQDEVELLSNRKGDCEARLSVAQAKLKEFEGCDVTAIQVENVRLREMVGQLDDDDGLQSECEKLRLLRDDIIQLRDQKERSEEQSKKIEDQEESLESQRAEIMNLTEAQDSIAAMNMEKDNALQDLKAMYEQERGVWEADMDKLKTQLQSDAAEVTRLLDHVAICSENVGLEVNLQHVSQADSSASDNRSSSKGDDLVSIKTIILSVIEELTRCRMAYAENDETKKLTAALTSARAVADSCQRDIAYSSEEKRQLSMSLALKEEELLELGREHSRVTHENDESKELVRILELNVEELQSEISRVNDLDIRSQGMLGENNRLSRVVTEKSEEVEKHKAELNTALGELKTLSASIDQEKVVSIESRNRLETRLKQGHNKLNEQISDLRDELAACKEERASLAAACDKLREDNAHLRQPKAKSTPSGKPKFAEFVAMRRDLNGTKSELEELKKSTAAAGGGRKDSASLGHDRNPNHSPIPSPSPNLNLNSNPNAGKGEDRTLQGRKPSFTTKQERPGGQSLPDATSILHPLFK